MMRRPLAARDPDPQAVADEIFAEIFDLGIRDHAAVLDLRIDQLDRSDLRFGSPNPLAIDAHRVAGLEEARMALWHAQAAA